MAGQKAAPAPPRIVLKMIVRATREVVYSATFPPTAWGHRAALRRGLQLRGAGFHGGYEFEISAEGVA